MLLDNVHTLPDPSAMCVLISFVVRVLVRVRRLVGTIVVMDRVASEGADGITSGGTSRPLVLERI